MIDKRGKIMKKISILMICLILSINTILIISSTENENPMLTDYYVEAYPNSRSNSQFDMILYVTGINDGRLAAIMEAEAAEDIHSGILRDNLEFEWESIESGFMEGGFVIYSGTINFEMYFSSTPSIDSVTFSSSLFKISNDNEILISNSESVGNINTEVTQINLIFNIPENIILQKSEQIKINLTMSLTTPTFVSEFKGYKGFSHPFGIHFNVEKTFDISIANRIEEEFGYIDIDVTIEDPLHIIQWGTLEPTIQWNGPTTPISAENISKADWRWYFKKDNALIGDYTFTISITDFQGHTINTNHPFSITSMDNVNNNDNNGNHIPENDSDENNGDDNDTAPGFETIFFFLGLIFVVLFFRNRRSIKSVLDKSEKN
jgi:hypothetical protein